MSEPIIEDNKYCPKCEKHKPMSLFGTYKRNKDGLRNTCKECTRNDVYKSRVRRQIKNESSIIPKLEKVKEKIQKSNDSKELDRLSTKLVNYAKLREIEERSIPENTLNLTYNLLFGKKIYEKGPLDDQPQVIIGKFKWALSKVNIFVFNDNSFELIPLKTRCIAVVQGIRKLTNGMKDFIISELEKEMI